MNAKHQSKFAATRWSLILRALGSESRETEQALNDLCRSYWRPLQSYLCRAGHSPEDAQDITQAFIARFIERGYLRAANPESGRFRTLLLTALKRFATNEWEKGRALKRGGSHVIVSLDALPPGETGAVIPAVGESPEEVFDRHWAHTILRRAMERLEEEQVSKGHAARFHALKTYLSTEPAAGEYAALSRQLGIHPATLPSCVLRLRQRYGELVREEVAHTLSRDEDVDDECRYLVSLVGKRG